MEYVTFGRTGLKVSVAGLGCGGNSRLGQEQGKRERESIAIVRQAMDLGVNLVHTAAVYRTEAIVGKAIQDVPRDQVVIATKASIRADGKLLAAADDAARVVIYCAVQPPSIASVVPVI